MSQTVRTRTDEIQIYTGDIEGPGKFNLTVHANYTPRGWTIPQFPGGIVPQGSVNGTFEAGAYLPVFTVTRSGKLLLDGAKLRALFAVPHADDRRFFYGLNFELSRNSRVWDQSRYGGEIRPIIGARSGPWDFIANPILDTSFNGLPRLDSAPSARVAYNQGPEWTGAVEYYANFGQVRHLEDDSFAGSPSRARRAPEHPPSPKTESGRSSGYENVPGVRRQVRPFLDHSPDMRQSEQAKDYAGGGDIGLHRTPPRCETVAQCVAVCLTLGFSRESAIAESSWPMNVGAPSAVASPR